MRILKYEDRRIRLYYYPHIGKYYIERIWGGDYMKIIETESMKIVSYDNKMLRRKYVIIIRKY